MFTVGNITLLGLGGGFVACIFHLLQPELKRPKPRLLVLGAIAVFAAFCLFVLVYASTK